MYIELQVSAFFMLDRFVACLLLHCTLPQLLLLLLQAMAAGVAGASAAACPARCSTLTWQMPPTGVVQGPVPVPMLSHQASMMDGVAQGLVHLLEPVLSPLVMALVSAAAE
jgi:hypothetical protein